VHIVSDLLGYRLSHAEVCLKYDINSAYTYKPGDRALGVLQEGIGQVVGRDDAKAKRFVKRGRSIGVGQKALVSKGILRGAYVRPREVCFDCDSRPSAGHATSELPLAGVCSLRLFS